MQCTLFSSSIQSLTGNYILETILLRTRGKGYCRILAARCIPANGTKLTFSVPVMNPSIGNTAREMVAVSKSEAYV